VSVPGVVEIRRRIPAPIAEVFDWWTHPEKLEQWMSPVGIAEASVDLRVGGAFKIVMKGGDMAIPHTGEFIEIEPPTRLVFTWVSPYTGPDPSLVTVELEPDGENATQLRLVHSQLPSAVAPSHRDGWGTMLDRMSEGISAKTVKGAQWPSTS
jgi:uncharacterized protein YndB with AHSA1/START domain